MDIFFSLTLIKMSIPIFINWVASHGDILIVLCPHLFLCQTHNDFIKQLSPPAFSFLLNSIIIFRPKCSKIEWDTHPLSSHSYHPEFLHLSHICIIWFWFKWTSIQHSRAEVPRIKTGFPWHPTLNLGSLNSGYFERNISGSICSIFWQKTSFCQKFVTSSMWRDIFPLLVQLYRTAC